MSAPAEPGSPRVAYLGPEGTYSEEALLLGAGGRPVQPQASRTIFAAIQALVEGEVDLAVVPIENSLDGSVTVTLDLLVGLARDVEIVGETLLAVRHALIGVGPVQLGDVQTVLTHPQVPGQCERLLRGELGHARVLPASSTAEAVRVVVEQGDPRQVALGPLLAASIYGGEVLREDVQDRDDNETRFVWLGPRGGAPALSFTGSSWTTSIVFWGAGAERPGWLVRCLDELARREINLTRIESRPQRRGFGSYVFFADLAGEVHEPPVVDALRELGDRCEQLLVLGSYPAA
jgi:prephenate dehydratase